MQKHALTLATALLGVGMIAGCGSDKTTAPNNTITYKATLSGANERPTNSSTAQGTWIGTLNTQTNVLTYTLNYTGLSAAGSGAHIHGPADANTSVGVILNFATFAGATTPFVNGSTSGSAAGSVNLSGGTVTGLTVTGDSLKTLMNAGLAYVNVHSTGTFQAGEIRGQIVKQ